MKIDNINKLSNKVDKSIEELIDFVEERNNEEELLSVQEQLSSIYDTLEKLKYTCFRNTMKDFTNELNKKFQEENLISKDTRIVDLYEDDKVLVKNDIEDNIYIIDPRIEKVITFPKELSMKDRYKLFLDNKEKIKDSATTMANRINKNRNLVSKVLKEIIKEIEEEYKLENNCFKISQRCRYTYLDGIDTIYVDYFDNTFFIDNIYYHKDLEYEKLKFRLSLYIKSSFKEKLKELKEKQIKRKIEDINKLIKSLNIKRKVSFKVINEYIDGNKLYDLSNGSISIFFDTNNSELVNQFKKEIMETIEEILLFEKVYSLKNVEKTDYSISNSYFFTKEKEIKSEEGIYKFYICRGKKRRIRLHIFLNDLKIDSARQRRKILKKYGNKN